MKYQGFGLIETEAPNPILQCCNMLQNMAQLNSLNEVIDEELFPRVPALVSKSQQECDVLKKLITDDHKYELTMKAIEGTKLAHYKNKKIYVPTTLTQANVE